jgi:hypothetical protein
MPFSEILITPIPSAKSATIVGAVAVGELVTVRIAGGAEFVESGLRIRVRRNQVDIARFPDLPEDSWSVEDETDVVGVLNMNTVQGFAAFAGRNDSAVIDCVVIVEMTNDLDRTLRVSGRLHVQNWPQVEGDTAPYNLSDWQDGLAVVTATAAATAATLEAHDHGTGGGRSVKHSDLVGSGATSHATIDSTLATLSGAIVTLGTADSQLSGRVDSHATLLAQHRHTGESGEGPKISHADLLDTAGTHAKIEWDIAHLATRATVAENVNAAQHASIADLGTRATALEGADVVLSNSLAALQAEVTKRVEKATASTMPTGYTAPAVLDEGPLRVIDEDMTAHELLRVVATLVSDLKTLGVLR